MQRRTQPSAGRRTATKGSSADPAPARPAISREQLPLLERTLRQLVTEHEALLEFIEQQRDALRRLAIAEIEQLARKQDEARSRITRLEQVRRNATAALARQAQKPLDTPLAELADLYPQKRPTLLELRTQLREIVSRVRVRGEHVARVAGAVLGSLNGAVRLLAGGQAGGAAYDRRGSTPLPAGSPGRLQATG